MLAIFLLTTVAFGQELSRNLTAGQNGYHKGELETIGQTVEGLWSLDKAPTTGWSPEVPRTNRAELDVPLVPIALADTESRMLILNTAAQYGLQMADDIVETLEPMLFSKGVMLHDSDVGSLLSTFSNLLPQAKQMSRVALAAVSATSLLSERFQLTREQITSGLQQIDVYNTPLSTNCPLPVQSDPECPWFSRHYRTADGSCNNQANLLWGRSLTPFVRFLPPDYSDGVSKPRISRGRTPLPSARHLSNALIQHQDRPHPRASVMLMQWGQFLDHDMTHSAVTTGFNGAKLRCCGVSPALQHPACFPILIPHDDVFYSHYNVSCMEFARSSPSPHHGCGLGPQEQINEITSYLDASNVYGSTKSDAAYLRAFKGGRLRETSFKFKKSILPPGTVKELEECRHIDPHNTACFTAGDARVNELPSLTAMHTVWLRQHNRLANHLALYNPHWDDEKVYQESRRIVGAMTQHITYNEFLPVVLGELVMKVYGLTLKPRGHYTKYDPTVNAGVANAFATAAFRFGHSLVPGRFLRYSKDTAPSRALRNEFFNPGSMLQDGSMDKLLLGLLNQKAQQVDEYITGELCNHLFQRHHHMFGMDLFAVNIQRGRDHGIPSYTAWRRYCSLKSVHSFSDLRGLMEDYVIRRLEEMYETVDDIDLYIAGLAEKPVIGGLVGPTFACIIAQQFQNFKIGDRFWYENGGFESSFTSEQLQELRKTSFARILCDNLDEIVTIQLRPMEQWNIRWNPRVLCSSSNLPNLNLDKWIESPG
ncbi:chorion peroxidase-like [Limulus polyphemus]|uniref:Chorion peroxidase-like n=1 Tax=Limulus polyphemus TaxID=6850 RepID=A0ABM1SEN5_LIMPO|nr:chorion peroxidase-like [Limulus polyphemus]